MAHITLTGTLLTPAGKTAYRDQIRFTHKSTTGETVRSSVDLLTIIASGFYHVELEYGLVLIEYKSANDSQFKNLGVATVNGTNPSTSIPELLNGLAPVSSAELIQFQAILADAVTAKNESVIARNEAEAFAASIDLINDLSQAYIFDTVAEYKASAIVFPVGKTVHLNDRGADFKVAPGTVSGDGVVVSLTVNQSLVIDSKDVRSSYQFGTSSSEIKAFEDYVNQRDFVGGCYQYTQANQSGVLSGKFNIKANNPYATINTDLHTCWIGYGGHESFENIIGTVDGTGANYSGVMGYDCKADGLASALWGFHSTIESLADHGTCLGGAYGLIKNGSFATIIGGTQNTIEDGNNAVIAGGTSNTVFSGGGSAILGGNSNEVTGGHCTVSGLSNKLNSGSDQSVIAGGGTNTINSVGAVISGGRFNQSLSNYSTISGGNTNIINDGAQYGVIAGGQGNQILPNALRATVSGGNNNTAELSYSTVTGGLDNNASGSFSQAGGRQANSQYGCNVWASGGDSLGAAQIFDFVSRRVTTDASEVNQYLDGLAVLLVIPENSLWAIKTQCTASDGIDFAVFEFDSVIKRGVGSTATSPTQNNSATIIHQSSGAVTWSHRVTVSSTGSVNVKATGEAGKSIKWVTRSTATQLLS